MPYAFSSIPTEMSKINIEKWWKESPFYYSGWTDENRDIIYQKGKEKIYIQRKYFEKNVPGGNERWITKEERDEESLLMTSLKMKMKDVYIRHLENKFQVESSPSMKTVYK